MLPIERLNTIKELIAAKQNIKISELSEALEVSEMTIHRDLKPLVDEGSVIKTFGGVSLVQSEKKQHDINSCVVCSREIHSKLGYRIILPNNQVEMACCGHCGLMRQRQLGNEVVQSICQDFFKQTTLSAKLAWFVLDTSINMGCCQPQVLTFENKVHADKFIRGFGGIVASFDEAMDLIHKKMNLSNSCCNTDE